MVGGYIEDDPRSCGDALWLLATGRGERVRNRCAPGDDREAGVVVEECMEGVVHGCEEANDVPRSAW